MNPFDYVNAINQHQNIIKDSENPELAEKDYVPFLINRSLSYFNDTIHQANEMNRYPDLPNILAFDFYLNSIRPRKRFSKWSKKSQNADVDIIKEYYGYNDKQAFDVLSILTKKQLGIIRKSLERGGVNE